MIFFYVNREQNSKLNFDVSMKMSEISKEMNQSKKMKNLNEVFKTHLQNISWQYTDYYDFKWKFMTYNVENKVWLNVHNIQIYLLNKKLNSKCFRLFQIINKFRKQAYKLNISTKQQIHSVFNVLLLKSFKFSSDHANQS